MTLAPLITALSRAPEALAGPFNVCSGRAVKVREVVDAFDQVASITVRMETLIALA